MTSNGGPTDLVTAAAPLAAGEETQLVASFIPAVPGKGVRVPKAGYYGNQPGTGTSFTSDAAAAVKITAKHAGQAKLRVESITAAAPPAVLPDWLGKRPPVPGDWVKTFDEEFDGPTIDQTKWNIYGPNYWDRASHWTKDNLILEGGMAKFRFEKKRGFHNDNSDPKVIRRTLPGKNIRLRLRLSRHLRQMGAALRLLRGPGEAAQGARAVADVLDDARPRQRPPARSGKRRTPATAGWSWTSWSTSPAGDPTATTSPCTWTATARSTSRSARRSITSKPTRTASSPPACSGLPGSAVFYCNGKELWRWEDPRVSNVPSHFIFEVTTGGWDNNAVDDKQLPADYLIDYVRVWQRKDLASGADGLQAAPKTEKK